MQGFECHQPHTGWRGRSPESEEAAEELEKVDVLRHHASAGGSGHHRGRGYPAMEEVTLEHDLKVQPNISVGGI